MSCRTYQVVSTYLLLNTLLFISTETGLRFPVPCLEAGQGGQREPRLWSACTPLLCAHFMYTYVHTHVHPRVYIIVTCTYMYILQYVHTCTCTENPDSGQHALHCSVYILLHIHCIWTYIRTCTYMCISVYTSICSNAVNS